MPKLRLVPGGINCYVDPVTGKETETHSPTCFHCQHMTEFPSLKRMFDHIDICRGCMKLICVECVGKPCVPWEKQCEIQELEHRVRERVHMQAWGCY